MKNHTYYVTTPIYYPNSKPHLGTLYSTVIADVLARWNRLQGKEIFFLTGLDEHGQKIEGQAKKEEMDPQQFVDSKVSCFKDAWARYECAYTRFIRTTEAGHEEAVVALLKKFMDNDDIYKSEYVGFYCTPDETFVTPEQANAASGNPTCPTCARPVHEVTEESYFFRLSAYQDQLLEFYAANPNFIAPKERLNEVISFVKSGLKDLSISRRTVRWGIPFPGDPSHTVYVWGDALTNYISAVGYGQPGAKNAAEFAKWWPADVQVMAKDIVRFHAVYWPAFLMAASLPLPKKLLVHGYILTGGAKMSKSLGNAIDPQELAQRYGPEGVRYYLMRHMAVGQDGHFDLKELENTVNADLANNLGNLLNRTLALAAQAKLSTVPPSEALEPDSSLLHEKAGEALRDFCDEMGHFQFHVAIANLFKFVSEINAYVNAQQPWKLAKTNRELFDEVISVVCHSLRAVGIMLWPVMPNKMEALLAALGVPFEAGKENYAELLRKNVWNVTFKLASPGAEPLFLRVEPLPVGPESEASASVIPTKPIAPKPTATVSIEEFGKVELHTGQITVCEPVEGSEKLLKLQVDFGPLGARQVLSGIAQFIPLADLIGRKAVFVTNFPPRTMMGLQSEGMILTARNERGMITLLGVADDVGNGTRIG